MNGQKTTNSASSKEPTREAAPSQKQLRSILEDYHAGRYTRAEQRATLITKKFPQHPFAWKVLGALFGLKGRKEDAKNANEKAATIIPHDAEAQNNYGVALQALGRLDQAEKKIQASDSVEV